MRSCSQHTFRLVKHAQRELSMQPLQSLYRGSVWHVLVCPSSTGTVRDHLGKSKQPIFKSIVGDVWFAAIAHMADCLLHTAQLFPAGQHGVGIRRCTALARLQREDDVIAYTSPTTCRQDRCRESSVNVDACGCPGITSCTEISHQTAILLFQDTVRRNECNAWHSQSSPQVAVHGCAPGTSESRRRIAFTEVGNPKP